MARHDRFMLSFSLSMTAMGLQASAESIQAGSMVFIQVFLALQASTICIIRFSE
jgi:hypothetical protein